MRAAATNAAFPVEIDSAGTGDWHIGRPPDPRAIAVAGRHGMDISGLRARQIRPDDFRHYDRLIALDGSVLSDLRRIAPADAKARLELLLDHADGRTGEDVAAPYLGEDPGFAKMMQLKPDQMAHQLHIDYTKVNIPDWVDQWNRMVVK